MSSTAPEESDASLKRPPLAKMTMEQILQALCSSSAALGSGTASCIVLALAAGCAAKAASLGDGADPSAADALHAKKAHLQRIAHRALERADEESRRFQRVLQSDQAQDESRLVQLETDLTRLADELPQLIDDLTGLTGEAARGDLLAAAWLHSSAVMIVRQNCLETERQVRGDPQTDA
jgi:hypothetical protein